MRETANDRYEMCRIALPKTTALLEPRRVVLEGALSQHYQPPGYAMVGDVNTTSKMITELARVKTNPSRADAMVTLNYFIQQTVWIDCKAPTYFLAPDIAEALLDTDSPPDLGLDDIRMPYPAFRVFIPRGILFDGGPSPITYIDISASEAGTVRYNQTVIQEVREFFRIKGTEDHMSFSCKISHPFLWVGWGKDQVEAGGIPFPYGVRAETSEEAVSSLIERYTIAGATAEAMRIFKFAVNIILLLSWAPDEVENGQMLRKAKTTGKGKILRTELWSPRFIGRPTFGRPRSGSTGESNGHHHFGQLRRAHWKRHAHGPGWSERKLIWISRYRTRSREDRGLPPD